MPLPIPTPCALQTPAPADTLGQTLKDANLGYEEIANFYKLKFNNTDTKRSQTVFVRKSVETFRSLSVREGFAIFYDAMDAPSTEQLLTIFQRRFAIGGIVMEAPSAAQPNWRLRFRMELPTDLSPTKLRERLVILQSTGDRLEQEFSPDKEDRF